MCGSGRSRDDAVATSSATTVGRLYRNGQSGHSVIVIASSHDNSQSVVAFLRIDYRNYGLKMRCFL